MMRGENLAPSPPTTSAGRGKPVRGETGRDRSSGAGQNYHPQMKLW